jgi:hypothetical protein
MVISNRDITEIKINQASFNINMSGGYIADRKKYYGYRGIEDVNVYTDKGCFVEKYVRCHELIVVTAEVLEGKERGKKVTETFNVLLKYDGTLEPNTPNTINRIRIMTGESRNERK